MPVTLNSIPGGFVFISVQSGQKYIKVNIRSGVPFQAICRLNGGGYEITSEEAKKLEDETFLII